MSHILITNQRHIRKINAFGAGKMIKNVISLQQNLINILSGGLVSKSFNLNGNDLVSTSPNQESTEFPRNPRFNNFLNENSEMDSAKEYWELFELGGEGLVQSLEGKDWTKEDLMGLLELMYQPILLEEEGYFLSEREAEALRKEYLICVQKLNCLDH